MKEWKFNYQVFSREIQIQNNCSYPQKGKKLLNAWREQNHVTISFLGFVDPSLQKKKSILNFSSQAKFLTILPHQSPSENKS